LGGNMNSTSDIFGRGEFLPAGKPPKIELKKVHRVVVEVDGRVGHFFVDGASVGEFLLDRSLREAQVSLYVWRGMARFDDLVVKVKDKASPAPKELVKRVAKKVAQRQGTRPEKADMKMGALRYAPTIHSIGFEWDIDGDTNHNGAYEVSYRTAGEDAFREATGFRIDYRGWYDAWRRQAFRHFNMFAGSIMFLKPGTQYEVRLSARDPDNQGNEPVVKSFAVATLPLPKLGDPARTLHVVPGNGGGDGSEGDPFRGLGAAQAASKPGDLFLLRQGEYEGCPLTRSGAPGRYVAWRSAGDGEAVLRSTLGVMADWIWIEGLVFRPKEEKNYGGVRGQGHGHTDIVVVGNTFRNCRYALSNTDRVWNGDPDALNRRWYFADNVVDGGPWTEYGTRVYMLADSEICYNRITTTQNRKGGDAISLRFSKNIDVHHNDIRDINDDGFEPDSSYANIRIWRNRCVNTRFSGISFQPMLCSPWYIVRNEFVFMFPARYGRPFKTNVFDRTAIVNNTFIVRSRYAQYRADLMLRSLSRNNLWVFLYDNPSEKTNPTGTLWYGEGDKLASRRYFLHGQSKPDWKTDVDYDGFSWEGDGMGPYPFWWTHISPPKFKDLASFSEAMGIEQHGVELDRKRILEIQDLETYASDPYSSRRMTLREGCRAVDAGATVPNLCEDYLGETPDLGAYEVGALPVQYGPRQ